MYLPSPVLLRTLYLEVHSDHSAWLPWLWFPFTWTWLRLFFPILLCFLCACHFFILKLHLSVEAQLRPATARQSEVDSPVPGLSEHRAMHLFLTITTFIFDCSYIHATVQRTACVFSSTAFLKAYPGTMLQQYLIK